MKVFKDKMPELVITFVSALIASALKLLGVSGEASIATGALILFITLAITNKIYRPIRQYIILRFVEAEFNEQLKDKKFQDFEKKLLDSVGFPRHSELAKNAGILHSHQSYRTAEPKIIDLIENARSIKLLTNTGQSDISKGTRYYDAISKNKNAKIKILIASLESPFISENWAKENEYDRSQASKWAKNVKDSIFDIEYLRSYHKINVSYKFHKLPFTWHLWIFDDRIAMVSAWLVRSKNLDSIRVFEIVPDKEADNINLFEMFEAYYDRIWTEQSEKPQ